MRKSAVAAAWSDCVFHGYKCVCQRERERGSSYHLDVFGTDTLSVSQLHTPQRALGIYLPTYLPTYLL